jgi:tryptophan-rich sensory protein
MFMDLVIPVAWAIVVAASGAILTDSQSSWYREVLKKPSWQPPDWAFGPAWSVIFGLAAWAFYLGLRDIPDQGSRLLLIVLFAVNGLANILWSPLFFTLRRPDWALFEVPLLWLSVLAPALMLWPVNSTAGWLLVPYMCWVAFAAYLNLTVVRINPPFGNETGPAMGARAGQ